MKVYHRDEVRQGPGAYLKEVFISDATIKDLFHEDTFVGVDELTEL
jgi:hypothetical protein